MIPLERWTKGGIISRNFLTIARLMLDTGGQSLVLRGPFTFASGSIPASTETGYVTYTHNANMPTTAYIMLTEPVDAGFGFRVGWTTNPSGRTASALQIAWRNNSAAGAASLTLTAYLLG